MWRRLPVWLALVGLGGCVAVGVWTLCRQADQRWDAFLILLATVIEAGSLWALYHLEDAQDRREQAVDVRVEIAYPDGPRLAPPRVWVDNAASGGCYVAEVQVVVATDAGDDEVWHCALAGKRHLRGHHNQDLGFEEKLQGLQQRWPAHQTTNITISATAVIRANGQELTVSSPKYSATLTPPSILLDDLKQVE